MKTQFTYNGPLTFEKRLARLERKLFWSHLIAWIVLSLAILGLLKLFWGWL